MPAFVFVVAMAWLGVPGAVQTQKARAPTRLEAIKLELSEPNLPDWAGVYGAPGHVYAAPRSGVCTVIPTCMSPIVEFAAVRSVGTRRLELRFDDADRTETWWSIRWGARHYLVPEEQLRDFCGYVNDGREPRSTARGWPDLKLGEESIAVSGMPDVPERWRRCLVSKQIETRVKSTETHSVPKHWLRDTETRIKLPVGSAGGITEDLCFFLGKWGEVTAFVEGCDEHECTVLAAEPSERLATKLQPGDRAITGHKR